MGNYCRRHLSGVVGTVPRRRLPPNSHLLGKTDENILDPAAAYLVFRDIRPEGRG